MGKLFFKAGFSSVLFFKMFVFLSLFFSAGIFVELFYSTNMVFVDGIIISSIIAFNYYFFALFDSDSLASRKVYVGAYFITQTIGMFAISYQFQNITSIYMGAITLIYATYFYKATHNLSDEQILEKEKFADIGADILENRNITHFFHDMLNHTHSLGLYLEFRIKNGRGLGHEESRKIADEIKLMQALLQEKYETTEGESHYYSVISFDLIKAPLVDLVKTYLPEHISHTSISFGGMLLSAESDKNNCMIHYPTVHRITNNLIKNISEAGGQDVRIHFDYDQDGLYIEARNKVQNVEKASNELKKLECSIDKNGSIGNYSDDCKGIGLKSVNELCVEAGGEFKVFIDGDYWVVKLFIPGPDSSAELYTSVA